MRNNRRNLWCRQELMGMGNGTLIWDVAKSKGRYPKRPRASIT